MINIKDCTDKCFGLVLDNCTCLIETKCEGCIFYKPRGCEDWVRVEEDGETYLYTPEEYETRRQNYEQNV